MKSSASEISRPTRRRFLRQAGAAIALSILPKSGTRSATPSGLDFPLVDFHVHLDNSTLDKVLPLSTERNVKFGIVEHAGNRENRYPVVLSNDAELGRYLDTLAGRPVYRGIQAEWTDWMSCFSRATLAKLDYVLSDAMTMPAGDGRRMKLWEPGAEIGDAQSFMDRYVDWHVQILDAEPLDILANVTWLPDALVADYDNLWTPGRMTKVIDAAVKHRVALEISSSYKIPRLPFLKLAKGAGAKFSFGSNGRFPNMGKLEYCIEMAGRLELKKGEFFAPARDGEKAVQRWKA
jgi:hypothetical protein